MSEIKNIPEGWVETTLDEVTEKMYSGGTPSTSRNDYYGGNIPWIRTQEVTFNKIKNAEIKITDLGLKNSSARFIPIDTVIVAMYGNSAGRVALSKIEATTNQACCNIISDKNKSDANFIFYNLLGRYKEIESKANGAAQQNLSVGVLKELGMIIPPLPEQKSIADILTSFDNKIELLQAQNKTLEETAQTIFAEWFGEYQIEDELPDGWKVGKLGDVTKTFGGTTPSTTNLEFWNGNIHWTSPKDLSNSKGVFLLKTEKKITKEGLKKISSGLLPKRTLLLSSRAPIGYLALTNIELAINQGYIALIPSQYFSNNFMYLWLSENMKLVESASNGSTFMEISKSSFRNIDCVIPNQNILEKFDNIIYPLFEKILTNIIQIQTLLKTRDELLPRLMSGEIRVNEFKK